jgi:hypothetical protein
MMKIRTIARISPPYEGGDVRGGWSSFERTNLPLSPLLHKEGERVISHYSHCGTS